MKPKKGVYGGVSHPHTPLFSIISPSAEQLLILQLRKAPLPMNIERPDLSQVSPEIRAYIEALETEIERRETRRRAPRAEAPPPEPSEPPTTINILTITESGSIKRTPRHHYFRQRRSGMGIFDMETPEDDPPVHLASADEQSTLLFVTAQARAYHLPVSALPETPVRARGQSISDLLPLPAEDPLAHFSELQAQGYLAMVSERGYIRIIRHSFVGTNLRPGTQLLDVRRFGPLVACCWTDGQGEVFIATEKGKAIRFSEKRVHPNGSLGIRLDRGDTPVSITSVTDESGVFLLSHDGKGTVRLMEGFRSNKSPGASGKVAMKTDRLIGAVTAKDGDDIFAISQLSKIIRFQAIEVPPKTGTVQGVNCMALRADECTAVMISR